jgi:hypothetical protein
MTLRPLSTPMRPRDEVVADIRRTREARNSPVPGGTETGRIGPALDAVWPEGTRGGTPTPAVLHDSNRAGEILLRRKITPMSGGSLQLRMFRNAIRDGKSLNFAASIAGMSLTEAKLTLEADAADPPPPPTLTT